MAVESQFRRGLLESLDRVLGKKLLAESPVQAK